MDGTRKIRSRVNESVVIRVGFFACGLMLGLCELKGGVYMLPLCVITAIGRPIFPLFAGALAASVITADGVYVQTAVLMALYGLLWLGAKRKKKFVLWQKVALAALSSLAVACGQLASGNIIFEDGFRAAVTFLFVPLSVAALEGAVSKKGGRMKRETGVLAAAFFAVKVFAAAGGRLWSLAPAAAAFVTLWLSGAGFAFGSVSGFVSGMACGLQYMPMMGILGFCFGMFRDASRIFAGIFSLLLSGAVQCYLLGLEEGLPGAVMTALGCVAFLLVERRLPAPPMLGVVIRDKASPDEPRLSAAFSSLSNAFLTVSREDAQLKKNELADIVCERVRGVCDRCHGCRSDKHDLACTLTEVLWKNRTVAANDLPSHIRNDCKCRDSLIEAANAAVADREGQLYDGMTRLAEEYLAFSRLICSADTAGREESRSNAGAARRVKELLRDKGVGFSSVSVIGTRRLKVIVKGVEPSRLTLSADEIKYMLSALLTSRLSEPEFVYTENGTEMRLIGLPVLRVECAKATVGKPGESVCGDTVSFFERDGGYFYSLISDGMGSGREAELASRLASIFLEKLLTLGADAAQTLDMLNRMLINKAGEIFTTVDLFEIDRMTGEARIIKAGAAPTFIYRAGECYRLDAHTAPVGIISEVKAAETKMKLKRGDFIIMTSDGITPPDPKPCLPGTGDKKTAAALASAIIEAWSGSAVSSDDMSVSVMKIA